MISALPPVARLFKTNGPKRLDEGASVPAISAVNPIGNQAGLFSHIWAISFGILGLTVVIPHLLQ